MSKVKLIVGAPGAGKSTYAKQQAEKTGGRVIDIDQIREIAPDEETAKAWRAQAEEKAHNAGQDVYIVRTLANATDRAEAAERLKADETIVLLTSAEIAKERASARDGNDDKHAAIDEWWETYTANEGETTEIFDGDDTTEEEPEDPQPEEPEPAEEDEATGAKDPQPEPTDDVEKRIAEARAEERAAVTAEYSGKLFNSAFMNTALSRGIDNDRAAILLKPLTSSTYLTETGDINTEELNSFFDALAPVGPKNPSSHGGYRHTEPASGKEFGADRAEQYLKKGI